MTQEIEEWSELYRTRYHQNYGLKLGKCKAIRAKVDSAHKVRKQLWALHLPHFFHDELVALGAVARGFI